MVNVTFVSIPRARRYERLQYKKRFFEVFNEPEKAAKVYIPANGKFTKTFVDLGAVAMWIAADKASWWNGGNYTVDIDWLKALPRDTRFNLIRKAEAIYKKLNEVK